MFTMRSAIRNDLNSNFFNETVKLKNNKVIFWNIFFIKEMRTELQIN